MLAAGFVGPLAAQESSSLAGQWLVPDGDGVIEIGPCGPSLCGWIVGMSLDSPDEPIPRDVYGRSQCGLQILTMRPEDGAWRGTIMDPRDGAVWRAEMWLGEDGNLRLRGYLGIPLFGRTQTWTPFRGRILAECRMPARAAGD
ncbi:DUF2147 domain-containing protein [Roseomonas sp. E05]|uniref:DUF2147 domain-containing protein n=1 Tax=Roseomonas sp. E05 TaxID=3046310 RepID=UPI0024B946D9|nr:DUF2147 domain-containing protein [Roseomonas sp. E05]MDJ0387630.1 DUF2147 domain-containing protein [Roseomonas sp. E05]